MSWLRVDDRELIRYAAASPAVCERRVLLGSDGTPEQLFDQHGEVVPDAFASVIAFDVRDTDPALVFVHAQHLGVPLAVFVWSAGGGPIRSANDHRLTDLSDRFFLESEGETAPPTPPQSVIEPAAVFSHRCALDDIDLGEGTVANQVSIGVVEMLDFIEAHATRAQIATIERVERRFIPMGVVNLRPRGGPAVGSLVIMLGRLPYLDPVVELRPDGQLRRSA